MKLYYFETPNPRRPCALARHLDLDVEMIRIDLTTGAHKSAEYLAINPNGKVPALTDGDLRLWESNAIMVYLAQRAGSTMWPAGARAQADVLRWMHWEIAHFSRHAGTLLFENHIRSMFGLGEPNPEAISEATGFFHQFAQVLDEHLSRRDWLVGDALTVADFSVAAMLPTAKEAALPVDGYRNVLAWHERLMALPAWRQPFPA